jgi:hypothetical protein
VNALVFGLIISFSSVSIGVMAMLTLAGTISLLCSDTDKDIIVAIRREYGTLSPLRLGAIFHNKRYSHGADMWRPIGGTMMYGWPIFILQLFLKHDSREARRIKEAKRKELFEKLVNNDPGYDK